MSKAKHKESPETDKLESARRQGQAQFDSIKEMVAALEKANDAAQFQPSGNFDEANEEARRAIEEDALSVQVRSGWYQPGAAIEDTTPSEYEILLCTGGPACRIIGELDEHGQPSTARMEVQDWFQPWTEIRPLVERKITAEYPGCQENYDSEPILLDYARCFYFGEG